MKFNLLALSALLALAAAADTTTNSAASTATASAEVQCANKCGVNDLCCVAACYKVPCPSDNQAIDTNKCVAACPQGTGSPADTKKYADCEQSCFSSHFFPATGAAAATGSSGSSASTASGSEATETGSNSSNKGATATSGSSTGTSTFTSQTSNAAGNLAASGAGLFGLVLAAFAL
ncbi:hypothetical protein N7462_002959 [Penicillium macrosclerotiorum]|uniref:uncharacterized protein n=1 Tax=Penicillium macrosclerotiorum TaxID=303699 RepID=UPI0025468559|nr:uncharacterized protein N7462_002959 [Penicillium macrosclerotiorum]KAJ5688567.1 hypothetical protein N7462_002959 [Penicillium macrosclerotiorum]